MRSVKWSAVHLCIIKGAEGIEMGLFAMFSAIPMPQPVWNEKNMRYALCAFPLVGAVCAASWYLWAVLAKQLAVPALLQGAGFCLLPVWITGGIHLDGYADTCDARSSYGDMEKKQRILSDPHCGAFAVIRMCMYFVLYFALCASFQPTEKGLFCMGLGFVLSRALSGLAVAFFPLAKDTGLAYTFALAASKERVRKILLFLTGVLLFSMVRFGGWSGAVMVLAALAVFGHYYSVSKKEFGGISGDLAGWFLQRAEIWMLAALVLCQLLEAKR